MKLDMIRIVIIYTKKVPSQLKRDFFI